MNHEKILPTDEKLNKVKSKFKTWRTIRLKFPQRLVTI